MKMLLMAVALLGALCGCREVEKAAACDVPASAEEVRIQASGNGATDLLDAAGNVVASRANKGQMAVLRGKRAKTEKDEFWGIRHADNIWRNEVRVGAPALPILCATPESGIVTK